MFELSSIFTKEEQKIIDLWKDSRLQILSVCDKKCYLLNFNGDLTHEECFGVASSEFIRSQKYFLASPRRMIKFYNYYLLENCKEEGEWYVGEEEKNGELLFEKCCESLEDAFNSL